MRDTFITADELRDAAENPNHEPSKQLYLEEMYSKHQLIPRIKKAYREAGFEDALLDHEINPAAGMTVLVQIQLHKQTDFPTMAGLILRHFKDMVDPMRAISEHLMSMIKHGFIDWEDSTEKLVVAYAIQDEQLLFDLDQYQYPLPCVEHPEPVTTNKDTGYKTIKNSVILNNNYTDDDVCLEHLNKMNSVPLSLNADVVAFVQNKWANLDRPKARESAEDFQKRRKAFNKYNRTSKNVLQAIMLEDRFWLTHKYDFRGRTYSQGYHVNYQGNDWNKACIELADAEPLNKE